MNVIVIGKPRIDETLVVANYLEEGNKKNIIERSIMPGGISVYVACMLAKWGINVYYQGIIGGEEEGLKIKSKLEEYKIDTKFLEITYEKKTNKNYSILNKSTAKRTNYIYDNEKYTVKHKYDLNPDFIITDGTDIDGAIGASNNYPNIPIILLANQSTKEIYNLTKRCKFVVSSLDFASSATKVQINPSKGKTIVDAMQKLQDLEEAKYTLNISGYGTVYVKDRQVKFIPKIDGDIVDNYMQEAAFLAAFSYGIVNNLDLDVTAKIANMASYKAITKVGSIDNIFEKNEIFNFCSIPLNEVKEETPDVQ